MGDLEPSVRRSARVVTHGGWPTRRAGGLNDQDAV